MSGRDWLQSYVETVIRRDVAQLADIRKAASLPLLLRWAAALTSNQINVSAAARDLEISHPTRGLLPGLAPDGFLVARDPSLVPQSLAEGSPVAPNST